MIIETGQVPEKWAKRLEREAMKATARDDAGQATDWSALAMVIDDDDLHVLSRSGDSRARDAHNGNFVSFHTIKSFRELVY